MPRRESADSSALFTPLVKNLAESRPFGKRTVRVGRDPRTGKLGIQLRNAEQIEQEQALERLMAAEEAKPETQIMREALGLSRQIQPMPELRIAGAASEGQRTRLQELFKGREESARIQNESVQRQIDSLLTLIGRKPQKSFEQTITDQTPTRQFSIDRTLADLPQGSSLRLGPLTLTKPAPTEEERSRSSMSKSGLDFLDSARQRLGMKGDSVGNPELLAYSRSILPETWQEAVQSPDSRKLYTDLDSMFGNLALLLTGRQGDIQRLRQLQNIYYFGGFVRDKPGVVANRFHAIEKLFGMFDTNTSLDRIHAQISTLR